ncbi:MAG: hypothetical protein VB949_08965 [Pseudomonadales bacterium]
MRSAVFLFVFIVMAPDALAAESYVLEGFEPWVEWVLHDHPDHACPRALGVEVVQDRCPTRKQLAVKATA